MRSLGFLALVACKFNAPAPAAGDAPLVDATADDAIDAIDALDATVVARTGDPIALWRFGETTGTTAADAVAGQPITLTLKAGSVVTPTGGGWRFDARGAAISAATPHTNNDVRATNAVTIEAWVQPTNTTQGSTSYALVAATSVSVMGRNFGLEQRGNTWVGRIRTSATTLNGEPTIVANAPISTTSPTHLVLVADGTTRVLYVNGVASQSSPIGNGGSGGWDPNFKIRVGDEDGADRSWLGTIFLLAIYDDALSAADVAQNFAAGFDCAGC